MRNEITAANYEIVNTIRTTNFKLEFDFYEGFTIDVTRSAELISRL